MPENYFAVVANKLLNYSGVPGNACIHTYQYVCPVLNSAAGTKQTLFSDDGVVMTTMIDNDPSRD